MSHNSESIRSLFLNRKILPSSHLIVVRVNCFWADRIFVSETFFLNKKKIIMQSFGYLMTYKGYT